ncbi:terminase small subunit [Chitinophaga varians]|uniref:terminase small subunit n=1 Tax=Chitinophaga varians TaxID=2202339 RepID=UPI00165FD976|nr:terminase small subunit [Chitinophaga varians]MBC9913170.1 terminase small subunit [Chitinophaga varians]
MEQKQKIFIKHYVKTGDHIGAYQKAVPGTNRKVAASCGKRWLKKPDIAAEIARLSSDSVVPLVEIANFSTNTTGAPRKMDAKEKRFCEEYVIDLNATQAAIRSKYSKANARNIGSELLTRPYIQDYIHELNDARSRRTEVTADNVLKELACIAFAKVTDFVRVEKQEVPARYQPARVSGFGKDEDKGEDDIPEEEETELQTVVTIFETDNVPEHQLRALASIKQGRSGIEVKLHSKEKALELIGRHLGMWNDKLQLGADEELKNLYKTVMDGSK